MEGTESIYTITNKWTYTIFIKTIGLPLYMAKLRREKLFICRYLMKFPQTRARPIPHQSFIQPNKFKYSSIDLLKPNGIHWTGKNIDIATHSNHNINNNTNDNCTGRLHVMIKNKQNQTQPQNRNKHNNKPSQNNYYKFITSDYFHIKTCLIG
eukprot:5628_1